MARWAVGPRGVDSRRYFHVPEDAPEAPIPTSAPDGSAIADRLDFGAARRAVADVAVETPLVPAPALSQRLGRPVLLKLESLQVTGSFKVRGAAACLSALDADARGRGVVACSSGNHGRAVSYVAGRLGIPATVYVPEWVDPVKLEGIRAHGAEAVLHGETFDEAEAEALRVARAAGRTYVSAYDDPGVIAGQGTLALEILRQAPRPPAAVVVPLSGGGLAGGIAAALRGASPDPVPVVAVSAANASVMLASVRAGHPVELPEEPTLADALAGGIGLDNRYSFPLIRDLIDTHVVVTEDEIARAMVFAAKELKLVVEGGAAVGLAALLAGRWPDNTADADGPAAVAAPGPGAPAREPRKAADADPASPVVVVVSGGNVDPAKLLELVGG